MGGGCCGGGGGPSITPTGMRLIDVMIIDVNNPAIAIYKPIKLPYFSSIQESFRICSSHLGFPVSGISLMGVKLDPASTVADCGIKEGDLLDCE